MIRMKQESIRKKLLNLKNLIRENYFGNKIIKPFKNISFVKFLYRKFFAGFFIPHLNQKKFLKEMRRKPPIGTLKGKRTLPIIISLTTFPKRINTLQYCLYSLLDQDFQADQVILWLTKEEFLNGEDSLPIEILNFKNHGLRINWCDNLRSYNKLLPSLDIYSDSIIVTADDDIYYPREWLGKLYETHQKHPSEIICHRVHRITFDVKNTINPYKKWVHDIKGESAAYRNFLTGVGGVLYPVNALNQEVNRRDLIKELCPLADDIWFWAMAVLNDRKIRVIQDNINELTYLDFESEISGENTLASQNVSLGKNDIQVQAVINQYPVILKKLYNEYSFANRGSEI